MQVRALSEVLGAELSDLDLTRSFDAGEQAEFRQLLTEYGLLVVRDQDLTADDQDRFLGYFGPVARRPDGKATLVTNKEPPRIDNTGHSFLVWHHDGMFKPHPEIANSLWAIEADPAATPTLFANGVRALGRLPADLRDQVESLHCVYLEPWMDPDVTNRRVREADIPPDVERLRNGRHEHPIVFQLPHVDKQTLYVDQLETSHIVELSLDEGEALIQELWTYLYADDNTYMHNWATGDIIVWDNIALQHARPTEVGERTRHLRRGTINGWYRKDGELLDWVNNSQPSY